MTYLFRPLGTPTTPIKVAVQYTSGTHRVVALLTTEELRCAERLTGPWFDAYKAAGHAR